MAGFAGPELCQLTALEAVEKLKSGAVSPTEMLEAALMRTAQVEPAVNATVTLCEARARHQITTLGPSQDHPGYLAGLPVSIKDLNLVKDVRTSFGTKGLADYVPNQSDYLVERLEVRGGVIVGKTNTPEMGAGGNTFNAVFGATRNPWDTRKNAGGSSGGAAVALATGEVWLSHGSDLAGSLRTPAAYCGVVGFRPTPGRVASGPSETAFADQGVSGPMARNVRDCALFLDAMAGFDARAPLSLEAPARSFQAALDQDFGAVKIAYAPTLNGFAEVESEITDIMSAALAGAAAQGVQVAEACPDLTDLERSYVTLRGVHYASINARLPASIRQHFKETLQGNIDVGLAVTADQIYDAMRNRTRLYHAMRLFLQDYDVLACAVVGLEPGLVENEYPASVNGVQTDDYVDWLKFSFLSTATALPAISIPCGVTKSGMPVGIQLIGGPRAEARVLQVARRLEMIWGFDRGVPIDPIIR